LEKQIVHVEPSKTSISHMDSNKLQLIWRKDKIDIPPRPYKNW
jgi:hypothetical protein